MQDKDEIIAVLQAVVTSLDNNGFYSIRDQVQYAIELLESEFMCDEEDTLSWLDGEKTE